MEVVLDACTLINLINGNCINVATSIPGIKFFVGENLLDQEILELTQSLLLQALISKNKIKLLESSMTVSEFMQLKGKYNLGDGETEGIALCKEHGYHFVTDDNKARKCTIKEIGEGKVMGTIYLLREAVKCSLLSVDEALSAIDLMKTKGAFLPNVNRSYFL